LYDLSPPRQVYRIPEGGLCYPSDSVIMRMNVGGWDVLPVGSKQSGEVCLSHIAEVLSLV
jgi:hypothetical protein